ncbi:uncharacterized protein Z520_12287 [Fonsecaea multimorphosa CBS 102226]|uniref:DUF7770 domain-containing protein n=1 Tax=Fonsecaea multimorphosa CBS 102226 TaxID=1442371 RepID=A0A0D2I3Z1_9EURO|nr:uncharacterized protein Z520_12287 [Fonsecaea multimorphosa CBS 102226]KIX92016.1 hypothetical protein Z520_12287 [Fonsecaea multimorphosa CBS 102226]OAL17373.1 hypothetical protein AYO22_11740 [Fonsecaea multimorphosa]
MSGAATSDTPIPQLTVIKVRMVAHTIMGAVVPGAQLSQDPWSIYLLTPGGGSVRLNMEWVLGTVEDKGTFTVKRHLYAHSNSEVRVFEYDVLPNTKVETFLQIVREKKRHNYKMTPTGVGCRFSVLTVLQDWTQAGLITTTNAVHHITFVIGFNYSKGQTPIKLDIKEGEWL